MKQRQCCCACPPSPSCGGCHAGGATACQAALDKGGPPDCVARPQASAAGQAPVAPPALQAAALLKRVPQHICQNGRRSTPSPCSVGSWNFKPPPLELMALERLQRARPQLRITRADQGGSEAASGGGSELGSERLGYYEDDEWMDEECPTGEGEGEGSEDWEEEEGEEEEAGSGGGGHHYH